MSIYVGTSGVKGPTLKVENVYRSPCDHTVHLTAVPGRDLTDTKRNLCPVQRSYALLAPFDAPALSSKVGDAHAPRIGRQKGIVDDGILEEDQHGAFPAPQRDEEPRKDERGHHSRREVKPSSEQQSALRMRRPAWPSRGRRLVSAGRQGHARPSRWTQPAHRIGANPHQRISTGAGHDMSARDWTRPCGDIVGKRRRLRRMQALSCASRALQQSPAGEGRC